MQALKSPASLRAARTASRRLLTPISKVQKRAIISSVSKFLDKEKSVANDGYNRWWCVPSVSLIQISIGSVYAFSMFNTPLTRELGVVASSSGDWALGTVLTSFSVLAVGLGFTTVLLGPWAERVGPRKVAFTSACCYSGGLLLSACGVITHQVWMIYLGYGILGGMGWGLGYVAPVSLLMKWFPDRRGLASGMALAAFGGGAMIAAPFYEYLFGLFLELPTYVGPLADVSLVTEGGMRYVSMEGGLQEVVVATSADLGLLPGSVTGAAEGVYLVGTGTCGTAKTFATLSAIYFTTIVTGALSLRVPKDGWLPAGWKPPVDGAESSGLAVHYNTVLKTPQFYLVWLAIFGNSVAGLAIITSAKTMINEIFGAALPLIVTSSLAAVFVASISAGNMIGRLFWAALSDFTGRKLAYSMLGLSIPVAYAVPYISEMVATNPSITPLILFWAANIFMIINYGGVYAIAPAYIADLFGQKNVGPIFGKMLTAWSASALVGPSLLMKLRSVAYNDAATELALKCDPAKFQAQFGAPVENLQELLSTKTVTISQLMQIAPPGTIDPTPFIYNTTMYAATGFLTFAFLCNLAIKKVDPKYFTKD